MAGKRLFCNRRWLNPNDPCDLLDLEHNYEVLTAKFPAFTHCSRIAFLQCLAEVCAAASSERASDDSAAALSPSSDVDADREERWSPESTRLVLQAPPQPRSPAHQPRHFASPSTHLTP